MTRSDGTWYPNPTTTSSSGAPGNVNQQETPSNEITPLTPLPEKLSPFERNAVNAIGFRERVAKRLIDNETALKNGDVGFGQKLLMVIGITAAFAAGGAGLGALGLGFGAIPGAAIGAIAGLYMGLRIVFFGTQEKLAYSLLFTKERNFDTTENKISDFRREWIEKKIEELQLLYTTFHEELIAIKETDSNKAKKLCDAFNNFNTKFNKFTESPDYFYTFLSAKYREDFEKTLKTYSETSEENMVTIKKNFKLNESELSQHLKTNEASDLPNLSGTAGGDCLGCLVDFMKCLFLLLPS